MRPPRFPLLAKGKGTVPSMRRAIDFFYDDLLVLAVKILGIVMVLVLLAQILSRILIEVPLAWTEELARFLFIWFCLLGSVIALRRRQHLGIVYFYNKIPRGGRRLLAVFIELLVAAFGAFVLLKGLELINVSGFQLSAAMRLPMKYVYLVFPIMGAMFTVQCALNVWDILIGKADY